MTLRNPLPLRRVAALRRAAALSRREVTAATWTAPSCIRRGLGQLSLGSDVRPSWKYPPHPHRQSSWPASPPLPCPFPSGPRLSRRPLLDLARLHHAVVWGLERGCWARPPDLRLGRGWVGGRAPSPNPDIIVEKFNPPLRLRNGEYHANSATAKPKHGRVVPCPALDYLPPRRNNKFPSLAHHTRAVGGAHHDGHLLRLLLPPSSSGSVSAPSPSLSPSPAHRTASRPSPCHRGGAHRRSSASTSSRWGSHTFDPQPSSSASLSWRARSRRPSPPLRLATS